MSSKQVALSLAAIITASAFLVAAVLYTPVPATAGSSDPASSHKGPGAPSGDAPTTGRSQSAAVKTGVPSWPVPKVVIARPHLDLSDELAALEALHLALTQVGDGSSYVWHRRNGRLSGIIRPTASFRDAAGKVCRHLELWLSSGSFAKRTEGIACRHSDGVWSLGD